MSGIFKRIIVIAVIIYIIITQSIISGYAESMDKLLSANNDLMSNCSKLSEGQDLNEIY